MRLWKCCTQYVNKCGTQQWPQDWKRSVFIPIPKKGNPKECSNYHTIALILHTSKVMLKILQLGLQAYSTWTVNFQLFNLDLEKAEEPEIKLPTCTESSKKQEFQKQYLLLLYWLLQSLWLCGSQQTVGNSSRDRNTRPLELPPEKSVCRSRRNS